MGSNHCHHIWSLEHNQGSILSRAKNSPSALPQDSTIPTSTPHKKRRIQCRSILLNQVGISTLCIYWLEYNYKGTQYYLLTKIQLRMPNKIGKPNKSPSPKHFKNILKYEKCHVSPGIMDHVRTHSLSPFTFKMHVVSIIQKKMKLVYYQ